MILLAIYDGMRPPSTPGLASDAWVLPGTATGT